MVIKRKKKYVENQLQIKIVRWFKRNYKHALIWSSLNGVQATARQKSDWKKEGLLKGVPDLQVLYQDKTIFIELKRPKTYKKSKATGNRIIKDSGGTTSKEQDEFILIAEGFGHKCYVVDTLEDFKKIIILHLGVDGGIKV